jgi:uncharacterized protein YgfB (UPF0149 family)
MISGGRRKDQAWKAMVENPHPEEMSIRSECGGRKQTVSELKRAVIANFADIRDSSLRR